MIYTDAFETLKLPAYHNTTNHDEDNFIAVRILY